MELDIGRAPHGQLCRVCGRCCRAIALDFTKRWGIPFLGEGVEGIELCLAAHPRRAMPGVAIDQALIANLDIGRTEEERGRESRYAIG